MEIVVSSMTAWLCVLHILIRPHFGLGAYQSAGCSDEGCGIPCYLRPANDECHYTDSDDSSCSDGGGDDLLNQLWNLNDTLVRLHNKLVQKGIIPAGKNCRPLPDIDHGGVIYSDLLISTGVLANYVCEEGYSLHGHGKYECAVDGVWLGNDTKQTPTCEDSLVICVPLVAIPNGHISYSIKDTTQIKPGDVVVYSCDQPYTLQGADYRVCLNNGTWTEKEPLCIAPADAEPNRRQGDNQTRVAVGVTFGIIGTIVLVTILGVVIFIVRKKWRKGDYTSLKNDTDVRQKIDEQAQEQVRQTLVETVH